MNAPRKTIRNQHGNLVPVIAFDTNRISMSAKWQDSACESDSYCGTTTFRCHNCGAMWDREEYTGGEVIRGGACNCGGAK